MNKENGERPRTDEQKKMIENYFATYVDIQKLVGNLLYKMYTNKKDINAVFSFSIIAVTGNGPAISF